MRTKKIISLLCIILTVTVVFSSCGYEVSIKKKDKNEPNKGVGRDPAVSASLPGDNGGTSDEASVSVAEASVYSSGADGQSNVSHTEKHSDYRPDGSYSDTGLSAVDVINMYKKAMDEVKISLPGYVMDNHINVFDVSALGKAETQLANNIIGLVAKEIIEDQGDTDDGPVRVRAGDAEEVEETFPLFDRHVGCELTDMSLISSAVCYQNNDSYKIVIKVKDRFNPSKYTDEYGKIMLPADRDKMYNEIKEHFVVLDTKQYQFDINYTQNEIVCTFDKASNHITGLSMYTVMDMDINLNMDLVVFTTSAFTVSGKIENTLEYTSFDWR